MWLPFATMRCTNPDRLVELKSRYTFTAENTEAILEKEVSAVFAVVLEDAGVYKCTADGRKAFLRFIDFVYR